MTAPRTPLRSTRRRPAVEEAKKGIWTPLPATRWSMRKRRLALPRMLRAPADKALAKANEGTDDAAKAAAKAKADEAALP